MPTYTFENTATGKRVDVARSIRQRNFYRPGWRRVIAPESMTATVGRDLQNPADVDRAMPRALRELERTMPADQIARTTGFSVEHLKRTWQT